MRFKKTKKRLVGFCGEHQFEILLFAIVFLSHGFFLSQLGWNQASRLDVIYAFVEPGSNQYSFRINDFITDPEKGINTGDWSRYEGNYYTNKAPGASFLGIPIYFVLFHLQKIVGIDPYRPFWSVANIYLMNLWITVFWSALGCVFLFRLLTEKLSASPKDAVITSLFCVFGTLIFPFDLQIWGHCTSVALLVIGVYFMFGSGKRQAVIAGLFLGAAVVVEYSAALVAAPFLLTVSLDRKTRPRLVRILTGMAPGLLLLCVYQKICFGEFLTVAPTYNNPYFAPAASEPPTPVLDPKVLWTLLFSPHRGLLVYMPLFLFVIVGVRQRFRDGHLHWLLACAGSFATVMVFLAMNGYAVGGYSSGPRYLIVILPFLCLLLPHYSRMPRQARMGYAILAGVSVLNMLVISCTDTLSHPKETNPLFARLYPQFLSGSFPSKVANGGATLFDLRGWPSLLPVLAGVGFGIKSLWQKAR